MSVVRLNLRVQPSMNGAIVGRLEQNDAVTVVGTSADGDWYQVQTGDASEGWVFADYIDTGAAVGSAAGPADDPVDGSAGSATTAKTGAGSQAGQGSQAARQIKLRQMRRPAARLRPVQARAVRVRWPR